ncbi:MAG TPA: hypothetical protein PKA02_02040 [Candidatus Saccharibacteria bacterium]|nr:hypothetical protein [Candidatus Saccharibacteria bacterium]
MIKPNQKNKNKILGILQENPNFQRACKKAGFARSTVYRWMESDTEFRNDVRNAQELGQDTMNDYVEAKLVENIQNNNQRSIEFYLRHNNPKYAATHVETEYFTKRSIGRVTTMPIGIDQVYYDSELRLIDRAAEVMKIRQIMNDVKNESFDPDEPIDPELFGEDFARELYAAFPGLEEAGREQLEEYQHGKDDAKKV